MENGKKWSTFVTGILDMTLEGLGEMFRGYSAETCAGKFPLAPMGETAHFGFCPPKIGFFRGVGGVPKIIFSLESSYFCDLGAHAKN